MWGIRMRSISMFAPRQCSSCPSSRSSPPRRPPRFADGPRWRHRDRGGLRHEPDGSRVAYEIGTLYAPENRLVAGSRVIGIGFARIRAQRPTGAPPIFVLPGGPGRSYLNALTATMRAPSRF
jgi:hypothetical protein